MDGFGAGGFDGHEDVGEVEVAVGVGGFADADSFVREVDVSGVGVGFGVDGDGFDTELMKCPDDADGDFSTIGD